MRPTRDDPWIGAWLWAMTLVLLWTPCAHAHVERGQAAGLVTGFGHPWSGYDHVLAMMAVGIWGARLPEPVVPGDGAGILRGLSAPVNRITMDRVQIFEMNCPEAKPTVISREVIQPALQGPFVNGSQRAEYTIGNPLPKDRNGRPPSISILVSTNCQTINLATSCRSAISKRSCIGAGPIFKHAWRSPWPLSMCSSSGTASSLTRLASCRSRSPNLVCKILISLLGFSETNTIG